MNKRIVILFGIMILSLTACGKKAGGYENSSVKTDSVVQEAGELFQAEKYEESLNKYLEAMNLNIKDTEARIGAVKCQMAMENYEMAITNLGMAVQIDPEREEIYDLYIEISRMTDNIEYAKTAVSLAKKYQQEDFLSKLPAKPELSIPGGRYGEKQLLTISSPDADIEIKYSINNEKLAYGRNEMNYTGPLPINSGKTYVTAYCIADGIPSETVTAEYNCEYTPSEVIFEDPIIEQLVRLELNKPEGSITDVECEAVQELYIWDIYDASEKERDELQIHSLKDLQWLPNLSYVMLYGQTEIKDYSELKSAVFLTSLDMSSCEIEDIDFIANMPNLDAVTLRDNKIQDIAPLLSCKQLRYVYIEGNPVQNLESMTELKNIVRLSINDEQLKDYKVLKQFEKLMDLYIDGLTEVDYQLISTMTDLEGLSIEYDWKEEYEQRGTIADLSFLKNLKKLSYLSLNGVSDGGQLEYIKGLTNLETLYLYSCDFEDRQNMISELEKALPGCVILY